MYNEDLKSMIKEAGLDRRDVAKRLGIGPMALNQRLGAWRPWKPGEQATIINMVEEKK